MTAALGAERAFDPTAAPLASRRSLVRRLWAAPNGRAGCIILGVIVLLGLASLAGLHPYGPNVQNALHGLKPPSGAHWLGTDTYGRDMFSRIQAGMLLSLEISLLAVAICTTLGTIGGVAAGYLGGWLSASVMSLTDLLFAVPSIILALAIVTGLGQGPLDSSLAVGIGYTPIFVRVVRGPVLAIREADYVKAGQVLGFSRSRLLFRHVLPAVGGVLVVQVTLAMGWAVLTEASLSFLGLGPQPPAASLGLMVSDGTNLAGVAWWVLAAPAVAIVLMVMGFNLVGDGLRDALDPTSRHD